MQCQKNLTWYLATSAIVKLFKFFKFNLLTTAILSKIHTVHLTFPSDTDIHCTKFDGVEPYLNFALYNFDWNIHCVENVQIRSYFWSVFSCIRNEYGDLLRKSPYSFQIQENTDQKWLHIGTLFTQWDRFLVETEISTLAWSFEIEIDFLNKFSKP